MNHIGILFCVSTIKYIFLCVLIILLLLIGDIGIIDKMNNWHPRYVVIIAARLSHITKWLVP